MITLHMIHRRNVQSLHDQYINQIISEFKISDKYVDRSQDFVLLIKSIPIFSYLNYSEFEMSYINLKNIYNSLNNRVDVNESTLMWNDLSELYNNECNRDVQSTEIPCCVRIVNSTTQYTYLIALTLNINVIETSYHIATINKIYKHVFKRLFILKRKHTTMQKISKSYKIKGSADDDDAKAYEMFLKIMSKPLLITTKPTKNYVLGSKSKMSLQTWNTLLTEEKQRYYQMVRDSEKSDNVTNNTLPQTATTTATTTTMDDVTVNVQANVSVRSNGFIHENSCDKSSDTGRSLINVKKRKMNELDSRY